jgi:hypothetical protein
MTEQDELKLPSLQPLPPEVRDRLRLRVMTELDAPRRWASRLDRARPPLAVAASVAVLAAGAMIVAKTVHDSSGGTGDTTTTTAPSSTSGATLNHPEADGELDRCWYALQQRGRAAQFPHRRTWHPVFNYTFGAVKVTAARADGKPLFCETTYTTATVSDVNVTPNYAYGQTGAVLITGLGTVAGVVDPSWRGIAARAKNPDWRAPATAKDGLFLLHGHVITQGLAGLEVGPNDARDDDFDAWRPLPRAAAPAASVVDRPARPAPDRTSSRGRREPRADGPQRARVRQLRAGRRADHLQRLPGVARGRGRSQAGVGRDPGGAERTRHRRHGASGLRSHAGAAALRDGGGRRGQRDLRRAHPVERPRPGKTQDLQRQTAQRRQCSDL